MNLKTLGLFASMLLGACVGVRAAQTTYALVPLTDGVGDTLTGSITTDGTLGNLIAANVVSADFFVTGPHALSYAGTHAQPWDASVKLLSASATDLSFAFATVSLLTSGMTFIDTPSGNSLSFTDASYGQPSQVVVGLHSGVYLFQPRSDLIATNAAAVPEPTSAALLLVGFGVIAWAKRRHALQAGHQAD